MRTGEVLEPLLVLKPSRGKWIRVLLGSLVFVVIGVWILTEEAEGDKRMMAWLCAGFFGLCALMALLQVFSGANRTIVTEAGLHIHTVFKTTTHAWQDIAEFGVAEWSQWHGPFRQRHRLVGINFREGSAPLEKWRRAAGLATALVGFHGALPDNYGYKHQELADLLNGFLLKFQSDQQ